MGSGRTRDRDAARGIGGRQAWAARHIGDAVIRFLGRQRLAHITPAAAAVCYAPFSLEPYNASTTALNSKFLYIFANSLDNGTSRAPHGLQSREKLGSFVAYGGAKSRLAGLPLRLRRARKENGLRRGVR